MSQHFNTPKEIAKQDKGKQPTTFRNYLLHHCAPTTQAAPALGIYRPLVCRYTHQLEKARQLWRVRKVICPITNFPALLITCNPDAKEAGQP